MGTFFGVGGLAAGVCGAEPGLGRWGACATRRSHNEFVIERLKLGRQSAFVCSTWAICTNVNLNNVVRCVVVLPLSLCTLPIATKHG